MLGQEQTLLLKKGGKFFLVIVHFKKYKFYSKLIFLKYHHLWAKNDDTVKWWRSPNNFTIHILDQNFKFWRGDYFCHIRLLTDVTYTLSLSINHHPHRCFCLGGRGASAPLEGGDFQHIGKIRFCRIRLLTDVTYTLSLFIIIIIIIHHQLSDNFKLAGTNEGLSQ